MGKSTISSGPFSIKNCNKLPKGILGLLWIPSNLQGIVGWSSIIIHHYFMGNPVEAMNTAVFHPRYTKAQRWFAVVEFHSLWSDFWCPSVPDDLESVKKSETFWGEHTIPSSLNCNRVKCSYLGLPKPFWSPLIGSKNLLIDMSKPIWRGELHPISRRFWGPQSIAFSWDISGWILWFMVDIRNIT